MLRGLIARLRGSEVIRGAAILASGTAVGQAVIIATTPVLTRIFSPEQYGILGFVASIATVLALVGTLSYDRALLLERDSDCASHLFVLVLVWSSLLSMVASAGVSVWSLVLDSSQAADAYAVWTGVLTLVTTLHVVLSMWAVRQKRYKNIAVAEGLLAIVMVAVQLSAGLIGIGADGLLGGLLAGTALAVVLLGVFAYRSGAFATLWRFDPKAKWALARKHYRFPLYAMPTSLLERSSKRLPVFLMALFFSPVEAGYYWLCFRFVVAPVRLIVQNSRKPYYKQALDLRAKGESLAPLFWNSTGALAAFAIPMVVAMILLAPSLFEILFGQEWQRAGQYAQWLTIATAASVLSMPCIDLAPIFQRQGHVLAFQTAQAIVRALAIVVGGLIGDDLLTIALFAISSCVMTVVMIGYFWRLIGTISDLGAIPAPEGIGRE